MTDYSSRPGFNLQEALARLDNNLSLLRRMVAALAEVVPAMRSDLIKAIESGDAEAILNTAHKFKGAVANFGQSSCVEVMAAIEAAGVAGDVTQARSLRPAMERELDRLLEAVQKI